MSRFTKDELYDIDLHLANARAELKMALDIIRERIDPEYYKRYTSVEWRLDQIYKQYHEQHLNKVKWANRNRRGDWE